MKIALAIVLIGLTGGPALAQSSYTAGYNNGYNDIFQGGNTPSLSTSYGRGFQHGQDDADEEDQMKLRQQQRDEENAARANATPTFGMYGTQPTFRSYESLGYHSDGE